MASWTPRPEHQPGVDVGAAGQDLAGLRPVDAPCRRAPSASRWPGRRGPGRRQQPGRCSGRCEPSASISTIDVVAALQRPAEPGDVRLAQAGLLGPVHDLDVRVGLGQLVGDVAGAIRAVVVHHQQVGLGQRCPDPARDRLQVLPLVVGRHDDDGPADRLIGGWMWLCHCLCLSLRLVNRRLTDGGRHDIPAPEFPGQVQTRARGSPEGNEPAGSGRAGTRRAVIGPGRAGKEKDPGSTFGPESVPLATGSASVVYWLPGPFPRPTPYPAGSASQTRSARSVLRLVSRAAGCERLRRGVAPKPDESAGPADEPGAGPEQQLTLDPGNVNGEP